MLSRTFVLIIILQILTGGVDRCLAADSSVLETTVPISLEGNYRSSSLVVDFPINKIDRKIDEWKPVTQSELAMKTFIDGIRLNDAGKVFSLLKDNPQLETIDLVKQFIDNYNHTYAMKDTTIIAEIPINKRHMFIWEVENSGQVVWTQDKWIRRSFTLIETNGNFVCDYTSDDPVEDFLLNDVLQPMRNNPDFFKPLPNVPLKYSIPISSETPSVTLKFNGFPCDLKISDANATSTNSLVQFYLESCRILTNVNTKSIDLFSKRLTPVTAERLKSSTSQLSPQKLQLLQDDILERRVVFFLDADPVYIIFYERSNVIHHEYIIQTDAGPLLTSLYHQGFLDDVLEDIDLANIVENIK